MARASGDAQPMRERAAAGAARALDCLHCGEPAAPGERFCCLGCRGVHRLLHARGLSRFYELRGSRGQTPPAVGRRDRKWLEPWESRVREADGACRVDLDVQGIHCSACVWLLEELFDREPDGVSIVVNPSLGKATLHVRPGFALGGFVEDVEQLGYLLGPPLESDHARSDDLMIRTGICLALAANSMIFAAAMYFGLDEGPVHRLVHQLSYALCVVSVLVGGSVFVRSAARGLRRGLLHLDLPIAVAVVLAFGGSTWSYFFHEGRSAYLDTLTAFIALMLLGRWLQQRAIDINRHRILRSDGAEGLLARRIGRGGGVELVRCTEIAAGDTLLVAAGDLVPTEVELLSGSASCSLDWIDGESEPRAFRAGDTLPAGAFNLGRSALRARATLGFADGALTRLLRTPKDAERTGAALGARVARPWVVGVLGAAATGFLGWWIGTEDAVRALEVAIAVLVITCPCAFGIATPLAYELVQSGLRRGGLFVRRGGFLDRAPSVRRIVFDKTGTLTTGALAIVDRAPLDALDPTERGTLLDLAARSSHPKSRAVADALEGAAPLTEGLEVVEHPGLGLSATVAGREHRLGAPAWAAPSVAPTGDLVYAIGGAPRAVIELSEQLRPDAADELDRLRALGYELQVLSGDAPERVRRVAAALGVPPERALGGMSPDDKAAWLRAHDRSDTLMIGDGINDSLAVEAAFCSGTPAVDRPFMAARSDFYFVTAGLAPVTRALRGARRLSRVVRRNLAFAVVYNVGAVSLALAGLMQPWLAAVLMPASSLVSLGMTAGALSGADRWRS